MEGPTAADFRLAREVDDQLVNLDTLAQFVGQSARDARVNHIALTIRNVRLGMEPVT